MTEIQRVGRQRTAGDAAVDGLWAGVVAGIAMAVILAATGLLAGEAPTQTLARFDPSAAASPWTGAFLHLAASAVYGAIFGLLWRALGRRWARRAGATWVAGVAYGLVLLAAAEGMVLNGPGSALGEIPFAGFALGHLAYGLVLAWQMGRAVTRAAR